MRTLITLETPDVPTLITADFEPKYVKIIKSIYDDSDNLVFASEINSFLDVIELTSLELLDSYIAQSKALFKSQIDYLFDSLATETPTPPSKGNMVGIHINKALIESIVLKEKLTE